MGITAGFGQLFTLSGMGKDGVDMTNDLTWLLLDVIDDMSPILEPKPNVRLHRNSPDKLLDRIVDMVSKSQGAPFLLNFEERSIGGLLREARMSGTEDLMYKDNVHDYASVGCLENTMVGNDRSGTVDNNINLLKAMELVYGNGRDFIPFRDDMTGKYSKQTQDDPITGAPEALDTFDKFWDAFAEQLKYYIKRFVDNYELTEIIRSRFQPTPYLSILVRGCAGSGRDITKGGAELSFTMIEGVTFATTVDSLLGDADHKEKFKSFLRGYIRRQVFQQLLTHVVSVELKTWIGYCLIRTLFFMTLSLQIAVGMRNGQGFLM